MFNTRKPQDTIATPNTPTRSVANVPARRMVANNEQKSQGKAIISKGCHIKGDITGNDDISIFGKVKGAISVKSNTVTIENSAKINANIFAKIVHVDGHVVGNIEATDKIVVNGNGNVTGDMIAARIILQDGSYFKGNVSMIDNKPSQNQAIQTKPKIKS